MVRLFILKFDGVGFKVRVARIDCRDQIGDVAIDIEDGGVGGCDADAERQQKNQNGIDRTRDTKA
jgi:hypothetical protein